MTLEVTKAETLLIMLALIDYATDEKNNYKNRVMADGLHLKIAQQVNSDFKKFEVENNG